MSINNSVYQHLHDENWDHKPLFPLQTIQSMAERWGKSRQNVSMWAQRDPHFPKEIEGVIEQTSRTPKVYPLYEVERFEQEKGLVK